MWTYYKIKKEVKEIKRLSEIVSVFFEEGLEFLIYELELHTLVPFTHRISYRIRSDIKNNFKISLLNALQKLGGLFVKGGQILSTRPDLIPEEYTKVLSKLQNKDTPFDSNDAIKLIEKELGKPINEIFKKFNKNPTNAASLSQVHKATLKDGTKVAIKVQKPSIDEKIKIDLKLINWIIKRALKKNPKLKKYQLKEAYEEIKRYTFKELDFLIETKTLEKFEKFFKDNKNVIIPHPYTKLCTKKIITMSWQEGKSLTDFYNTKKGKIIHKRLTKAMIDQYFKLLTFQGDPHPGNFFITKDLKIIFLDLGMIGQFDKITKKRIIRLFLGIANHDAKAATEEYKKLDLRKEGNEDYNNLLIANTLVIEEWKGKKVKDYSLSRLYYKLMENAINHGIQLPPSIILFGKSLLTVSDIFTELNPEITISQAIKPRMIQIIKEDMSLKAMLKYEINEIEKETSKKAKKLISKTGNLIERLIEKI